MTPTHLPPEVVAYMNHKPTCNMMQDWTEAQEALSLCPDGPDKDAAYSEMETKMKKCTCGLDELLSRSPSTEAMVERIVEAITQGLSINPGILLGNSSIKLLRTAIHTALEGGEHGN